MRSMTGSQRGMLVLSLAAALFLAACGGSSAVTTGTATATAATGATATSTAAAASTVIASTRLCDLLSVSAVSSVVGGTIGSLQRNVTTAADGSTSVNCTYLPSSGGGVLVDAEISYLFTSNGPSAYAKNKADDAARGETETAISGLGDAAFWAVSATHKNVLQLSALTGNVLLLMTLGGAGADGSTMLSGAEGLARQALPSL